ncbi:glycosyl transferase family 1 [Desulfovibrio sp. SGI.169]|uniref:glycosyl transferase family 1 n=1 Tax=Desulfovibrio sp. SGI.169 TaxID=3420561 RepID=UPI003CFF4952
MPRRDVLYLAVSLDVEEEGLFGGRYARRAPSVANTARLPRLRPLLERGVRPTLFCAHSVLTDPASRAILARLRDHHGAEIGAHLHHWNTPPLRLENDGANLPDTASSVPASAVPAPLMAAKLAALFRAGAEFQSAPLTSFRMGRWDLHRAHWPLLARAGVLCDASVRPLHGAVNPAAGPDHFSAPASPYWTPAEGRHIFEVPLTVTPLLRPLPGLCLTLPGGAGKAARAGLKKWGALALLPVYHPLWAMRAITRLFVKRGGRVLSLTWHSSEMLPGGTPHLPDAASVEALMRKIEAYLDWLRQGWEVRSLTMNELRCALGASAPCPRPAAACDWTTGGE